MKHAGKHNKEFFSLHKIFTWISATKVTQSLFDGYSFLYRCSQCTPVCERVHFCPKFFNTRPKAVLMCLLICLSSIELWDNSVQISTMPSSLWNLSNNEHSSTFYFYKNHSSTWTVHDRIQSPTQKETNFSHS